uniref:Uncharacterized protein n=1 Tax=Amphimedon queenslandica TaxID=400682 RepID=A0A1X7UJS7_AMPQE
VTSLEKVSVMLMLMKSKIFIEVSPSSCIFDGSVTACVGISSFTFLYDFICTGCASSLSYLTRILGWENAATLSNFP